MKFLLFLLLSSSCLLVQAQFPPVTTPSVSPLATVTQRIGLTDITVRYSRPGVKDREVWGSLVPYNEGEPFPWRAGADENTTISFTHEVKINGKTIPAGTYGIHVIPDKEEWIIAFSNNATSWGSFFYKEKEDALRVKVTPTAIPHKEWLEFEFTPVNRKTTSLALKWAKLQGAFEITVAVDEIVLESMRNELRSTPAFSWVGWYSAAAYCLKYEVNLEEALRWCEESVSRQKNFTNLSTQAKLLEKLDRSKEAEKSIEQALAVGTVRDLHAYGRELIEADQPKQALKVFQINAERHPDTWPVNVGLGRGHMALGDSKTAVKYFKKALKQAPDEFNRDNLQELIDNLEQ